MSFPSSFHYENEADFIRRLVVPVLQRLGFDAVTNYHGMREHGKDLVFGETDRFGLHIYHGLQAKYAPSISQKEAFGLIDDARQAFTMPFQHPTSGTNERISKFYVVNGGSISDNVRDLFFNALRPHFGANVRLIDGDELVALERHASIVIEPSARALTQLLRELTGNRASLIQFVQALGAGESLPEMSVREDCTTEYLKNPCFENEIEHAKITAYSNSIRRIQDKRTFADTPFIAQELRVSLCMEIDGLARDVLTLGEVIDACIRRVLAGSGPLLDP
jgi:hypothetical protein